MAEPCCGGLCGCGCAVLDKEEEWEFRDGREREEDRERGLDLPIVVEVVRVEFFPQWQQVAVHAVHNARVMVPLRS